MEYGILKQSAAIYEHADRRKNDGSAISDQVLYGMPVKITGQGNNGFLPITTYYGYSGYVEMKQLKMVSLEEIQRMDSACFYVADAPYADVLSIPSVQGEIRISLARGSIVEMPAEEAQNIPNGWAPIRLLDGETGYIRPQYLMEKKFSVSYLWNNILPQRCEENEDEFRKKLVYTARKYLGTQYRWGGKSSLGIDCSGLVSMAYMLNGVLIYRDAVLRGGFPVKPIPIERIKPGDLLYFKGHVAMYIGNDEIIHATGHSENSGVVINSLNPQKPDYREDLAETFYLAGSIFPSA